jgi:hypothetical protein
LIDYRQIGRDHAENCRELAKTVQKLAETTQNRSKKRQNSAVFTQKLPKNRRNGPNPSSVLFIMLPGLLKFDDL